MEQKITYRGHTATTQEIEYVRRYISQNPQETRRRISQHLCTAWDWRQANGALKDRKCRGLLLELERAGCIQLPAPTHTHHNGFTSRVYQGIIDVDTTALLSSLQQLLPVQIMPVRRTPNEQLCDGLIARYHYLRYSQPVGEHIKYLVSVHNRPIACLIFSSAPRHIGCRDRFIRWDATTRRSNIHLIAYNTRFLILPWVKVKHLASHLLACIARRISADWQAQYQHPVHFLETFVDTERFAGTCYKAANWTYLGLTTGRGKNDQTNRPNRSIKAVWGYPLRNDFREVLAHVHE
jgi:hypothetical protein